MTRHSDCKWLLDASRELTISSLRRALPVTRQKVDWDKVSGYTLGSDLSKAKA